MSPSNPSQNVGEALEKQEYKTPSRTHGRFEQGYWRQFRTRLRPQTTPLDSAPSWIHNSDLLSILPHGLSPNGSAGTFSNQLKWYNWWISKQLESAPKYLLLAANSCDADSEEERHELFKSIWGAVATYLKETRNPSIDDAVCHLIKKNLMSLPKSSNDSFASRQSVFAIIGWQTMLYSAETGVCPPGQLTIRDEMDGYKGQSEIELRQDQSRCKRPLHSFLMGFGLLLPSDRFCRLESHGVKNLSRSPRTTSPGLFNAFLLESIGKIEIRWVDFLTYHLEFDEGSRTLYLFRFPSFCLANIPPVPEGSASEAASSVLHSCAAPNTDAKVWATRSEITSALQQTILTYRLLFGQSKPARQFFRKLQPFNNIPVEGRDQLLEALCARKQCELASNEERHCYDLERDFSMYANRISALHNFLAQAKPRTWKSCGRINVIPHNGSPFGPS